MDVTVSEDRTWIKKGGKKFLKCRSIGRDIQRMWKKKYRTDSSNNRGN
jgi:hypothetical protein